MEILFLLTLTLSPAYVLYHFGNSFGQIIVDSQGGQNCAINGISSNVDTSDVQFVSRGAYFQCCQGIISLPKNECYESAFGSIPFSIGLWLNSQDTHANIVVIKGTIDFIIARGAAINTIRIDYPDGFYDFGERDCFQSCNSYIAQWVFVLITFETQVKIYINTVLQLISSMNLLSDVLIESITLGSTNLAKNSFSGLMWYVIYSFSIINSGFVGPSTNSCLVSGCLDCTYSIINLITEDHGCLENDLTNIPDTTCSNNCFTYGELGCINSKCLKCYCGSCSRDSSGNCNCETSIITTSISVCDCNKYNYFNFIEKKCNACLPQCENCSDSVSCDSCKDINSLLDSLKVCVCKNGFWWNFANLNGVCSPCKSDCLTCNQADSCLTCIASNSFVNRTGNCECDSGYFGKYPLISIDSCEKCAQDCTKCSNKLFYQCIACSNSYYYYGMCLKNCPFGYQNSDENKCVGRAHSSPIMDFRFNTIGNVFVDNFSNSIAVANNSILQNSSERAYFKTIPNRGIYLKGIGIEINQINGQSLLSAQTSISIWLKPNESKSSLFYKGNITEFVYKADLTESSISLSIKIDNIFKLCNATSNVITQSWHHIFLGLNYSNYSRISIIHNGLNKQTCTYEAPFLDNIDASFFIAANLNSSSFFNGYIYEYSQFVYQPSISELVSTTCNGCGVCLSNGACIQNCSNNQFFSYSLDQCIDCSMDCPNGCTMLYSCNVCFDNACLECTSFSANSCSKCMDFYEVVNGTCSRCKEGTYYDYKEFKCKLCEGLCTTCVSASVCLTCKEKSEINSNKSCECVSGFIGNGTCEQDYFKLWVTVRSDNTLGFIFSEPLSKDIIDADVKIWINKTELKFTIQKYDDYTFILQISFTEEITENNNEITIEILSNLTSESNKILLNSSYFVKLLVSSILSDSLKKQKKMAEAKD